ncbi:hypothetical protein CDD83_3498 [Cordyceps sp. RAO-2017]|nr:hypothetical protein CDD83_3498 [Cordyceps sp. RAO-2017]
MLRPLSRVLLLAGVLAASAGARPAARCTEPMRVLADRLLSFYRELAAAEKAAPAPPGPRAVDIPVYVHVVGAVDLAERNRTALASPPVPSFVSVLVFEKTRSGTGMSSSLTAS